METWGTGLDIMGFLKKVVNDYPAKTEIVVFCPWEFMALSENIRQSWPDPPDGTPISIERILKDVQHYRDQIDQLGSRIIMVDNFDNSTGRLDEWAAVYDIVLDEHYQWRTVFLQWDISYISSLYDTPYVYHDLQHTFICKNSKSHNHRCDLMDALAKFDLLQDNVWSWRLPTYEDRPEPWDFKYWTEVKQELPEEGPMANRDENMSGTEPAGYKNTLIDLVSESNDRAVFITEKTAKPLSTSKPFVIWGAPGTNLYLEKMGFQLYDELFDYSFDNIQDNADRASELARQLAELAKRFDTPQKRQAIMDQLWHKRMHNVRVLCNIGKTLTGMPDIVKHIDKNNMIETIFNNTEYHAGQLLARMESLTPPYSKTQE